MIQPNELRIGNWVTPVFELQGESEDYEYLPPSQVSEVPIQEAFTFYEGIPLTEEWLLKLGARKDGETVYVIKTIRGAQIHALRWEGELKIGILYGTISGGSVTFHHIKFVHQLQNLYFALTGEELTLTK